MYLLAIRGEFIAQHYLIGGDWGAENLKHSHHYQIEVQVEGDELDRHGYLVDIVDLEARLKGLVTYYRDKILNDLPEFSGLNPSLENFCNIMCQGLATDVLRANIQAVTVKLWENENAWAAHRVAGVSSH